MAVKLLFNDIPAFFDSNGDPLNGGKLFTYAAGSSTKQNTYTTSAGSVAQANPIVLNSRGEPANAIWGTTGLSYKLVLSPSTDSDPPTASIWTIDNVTTINDTTVTNDQWVTGPTPTYISATSLSLVGDQTSTFGVGRRIKTTNSGGTIYSVISVSAYTTLTTLTVVNDSGTLDSGLSAVSYGSLTATNISIPKLTAANKRLVDLPGLSDANTWTGAQTMSAAAVNEALSTVASAATPDIWTGTGNVLDYTGTVTATGFAAAPQAGARRTLVCAGAAVFTAGANMLIDGVASGSNFTAAAGDKLHIIAVTATQFRLTPAKYDGTAVAGSVSAATATEIKTGTVTNKYLAPDATLAAIGFSARYNSGNQTITTAGSLTLAHGLGREPILVVRWLKCLSAQANYSIGDKVLLSMGDTVDEGISLVPDSTNLNLRFSGNSSCFNILDKTTGLGVGITNSSWALIVEAFA